MLDLGRYVRISLVLLGGTAPLSVAIGRRYGFTAGRRFGMAMGGNLLVQEALVGLAARRANRRTGHELGLVDVMTLSRGATAALLGGLAASGVRDRRGLAGWMGWLGVLYGAILCDWLDGPIARHTATSELGEVLDREADSWLTLCTALAAVRWGGLPRAVLAPPLMRYAFLLDGMRRAPYATLHGGEPSWVRQQGIAQMLLFIASLAPFGGRVTRRVVCVAAPIQVPLQLGGLLLQRRRER
ncbi:MAG TPA: CDP-alcohol phosphatidyltransferase family protein [Chloroflexota bacterium]|nr:CDP-alcohol phosphatidyltransferase family protein [Chloroflexota bacterium]